LSQADWRAKRHEQLELPLSVTAVCAEALRNDALVMKAAG